MPAFLDRLAASAARRLLAWLSRRVPSGGREWVDALTAESECVVGGWQRLRWAMGGLPLVWTINRSRQMDVPVPVAPRVSLHPVILNLVAIVGWWVVIAATLRPLAPVSGHLQEVERFELIILATCALGAIAALGLRAKLAGYLWAGLAAFVAVELPMHVYFGYDKVQGGPAHFAVMGAGWLGVILAASMQEPGAPAAANGPPWNAQDLIGSLRSLRRKHSVAAHLLAVAISFIGAESVIRSVFLFQSFRDGLTNYAILGAAMLGVVFGVLIARYGSRVALRGIAVRGNEVRSVA